MVNFKSASIFKGILETQNPAQNEKNFAETGRWKIARRAVYHAGIDHDTALGHERGCPRSLGSSAVHRHRVPGCNWLHHSRKVDQGRVLPIRPRIGASHAEGPAEIGAAA